MSTHMSTQERRPFWRCVVERFTSPAVPDFWIVRKYVVIIVLGVSVWALYVAIGRVCVPAIHSRPDSAFTRGAGIGILVPYLILWLLFVWSYVTVCSRVIPVSEDPAEKSSANVMESFPPASWNVDGSTDLTHQWGHDLPMSFSGASTGRATMRPTLGDRQQLPSSTVASPTSAPAFAPPDTLPANFCQTLTGPSPQHHDDPLPAPTRVQRPVPGVSTQPRWCKYCKIVKPDRTHHCRHCGTCVLQFDHHCVWIGRCVGWKNHAIFVTFCLWAGMLCLFNFIVLVVDTSLTPEIDGQKVALIAICGFLFIFTLLMMLPTHVYLITAGRSTVESFQTGDQNRAEEAALKLALNNPICPTKEVRAVKKSWEAEYGGVAVNDRWRFSDRKRDLWKQQMGRRWTGWIFPVGRPEGDGIHFPANPRFGPNGEWIPVRDWPKVVAI